MDATHPWRHSPYAWKEVLLALIGLAVIVGLVAGARALDWQADRQGPMYRNVLTMAGLQWDLLNAGKQGVEVDLDSAAEFVAVGDKDFTPSPGVRIVVEQQDDSYCVKGWNQYGDETAWHCVDGSEARP